MTLNCEVADSQPARCATALRHGVQTQVCAGLTTALYTLSWITVCATPGERTLLPLLKPVWEPLFELAKLNQAEVSLAKEGMSEARIPRKHKGEVLSQSSEHAKAVRRQPKRRAGIKGRREYDVQAERRQQNVSVAMLVHKFRLFRCTLHWQSAHMSASATLCMAH